ncbi:MAG: pitrilysin family protein [Leptolyngbyaceae bacterium]|nr:pitrilysin family protein [Leptolyngbyaceae bacterium]
MTSGLIGSPLEPLNSAAHQAPTVRKLPNGLTVITEHMETEAVNLSLWLNVGSTVEPDPINGMAHFLEHMVFKGTKTLQGGEFESRVEQRGAVTNAATSQDYTYYYITTAPQDFAALTPLQVEVVLNAAIPDDAFERERSVVLEEIRRANDNPSRRMLYRSMETAFEQLPYRRPVLGPSEVIETVTASQMRDFHRTWYQPSSITAVAIGNLPEEELSEIVIDSFDQAFPGTARPESPARNWSPDGDACTDSRHSHVPEIPFQSVIRHSYVDEKLQQARLVLMWRVPGILSIEDTYSLDVLASILGHGRTSRMVRDLREERGLVSSISVSNTTFAMQGMFYISVQLPQENIPAVEQAILQHIQAVQQHLVAEAELNRVRTLVANRYIFGNETPSNRAGLYGYYQAIAGDITSALDYPERIRLLDVDMLQYAAQRYLSTDAYGVVEALHQ